MSLPSGYTRLEYIQSNGAQYINAGLSGSSKTRVVCTISNWPKTAKSTSIFGCRAGVNGSDRFLILCAENTGTYRSDFYNSNVSISDAVSIEDTPVTIDKNKNVTTFSNMSTSFTNTSGTFTSLYDLYIFACNTGGTAGAFTNGVKLYSMQIYTDDTLMRDYIPCKNANGVVGLWDDVWSVFYPNSGSGNFTAGPVVRGSHQALVSGTAYNITGGRTLIGGTGYGISKGMTLVGGTGYDIAFPAAGTPLSDFAEGSVVKLNENGSPVEFYVAKHNYESGLNGTGRTLLVRKKCYPNSVFVFGDTSRYSESIIHTWLTGTYKGLLDADIQAAIALSSGRMRIPCVYGGGSTAGINLYADVFIPSATELGKHPYSVDTEGSLLPIASTLDTEYYWTRSPYPDNLSLVIYAVQYSWDAQPISNSHNIRPCFTLPGTTLVDADNNVVA